MSAGRQNPASNYSSNGGASSGSQAASMDLGQQQQSATALQALAAAYAMSFAASYGASGGGSDVTTPRFPSYLQHLQNQAFSTLATEFQSHRMQNANSFSGLSSMMPFWSPFLAQSYAYGLSATTSSATAINNNDSTVTKNELKKDSSFNDVTSLKSSGKFSSSKNLDCTKSIADNGSAMAGQSEKNVGDNISLTQVSVTRAGTGSSKSLQIGQKRSLETDKDSQASNLVKKAKNRSEGLLKSESGPNNDLRSVEEDQNDVSGNGRQNLPVKKKSTSDNDAKAAAVQKLVQQQLQASLVWAALSSGLLSAEQPQRQQTKTPTTLTSTDAQQRRTDNVRHWRKNTSPRSCSNDRQSSDALDLSVGCSSSSGITTSSSGQNGASSKTPSFVTNATSQGVMRRGRPPSAVATTSTSYHTLNSETALRLPLSRGWRRSTTVRRMTSSGVVDGRVVYVTPSEDTLGCEDDVIRYLYKNRIRYLSRQYFNFSPTLLIGDFLISRNPDNPDDLVHLSEKDMRTLLIKLQDEDVAGTRKKRGRPRGSNAHQLYNLIDTQESKLESPDDTKQNSTTPIGTARNVKGLVFTKNKDTSAITKPLLVSTKLIAQRNNVVASKLRELEEDMELEKENEKFRKEQEKIIARDAYLEKMRLLRQPAEDLELTDSKILPVLDRLTNFMLDSETFADLLMVLEFVSTFGCVLNISKEDIPNLRDLHDGILNVDAQSTKKFRKLSLVLLTLVLEYPGIPQQYSTTFLNVSFKNCTINQDNMSELLRMFLNGRGSEGAELAVLLNNKSFESLRPAYKASILSFMCNELLYCRNVVREIEQNLDSCNRLKSERWMMEYKNKQQISWGQKSNSQSSSKLNVKNENQKSNDDSHSYENLDENLENHSSNSNSSDSSSDNDDEEDSFTLGALKQKVVEEKSVKSQKVKSLNREIRTLRKKVRQLPVGQDRFHRIFWNLPSCCPGILIESIDTSGEKNCNFYLPFDLQIACQTFAIQRQVADCLQTLVRDVCENLDEKWDQTTSDNFILYNMSQYEDPFSKRSTSLEISSVIPENCRFGWNHLNDREKFVNFRANLHNRGIREKIFLKNLTKLEDNGEMDELFQSEDDSSALTFGPSCFVPSSLAVEVKLMKRIFKKLRNLEEKIFFSNVSIKNWRPPDMIFCKNGSTKSTKHANESHESPPPPSSSSSSSSSSDNSSESSSSECDEKFQKVLNLSSASNLASTIRNRMLSLYENIERRFLKEECFEMSSKGSNEQDQISGHRDRSSNVVQASWRHVVGSLPLIELTPSRLSLCLDHLDRLLAWEKSAARAQCQICRRDDDDHQLLLCDGCDMGYHTYCFKPKLNAVPDGDWYCPVCVSKATRRPCCLLCCRQIACRPLVECNKCHRDFHCDCVLSKKKPNPDDPDWICQGCASTLNEKFVALKIAQKPIRTSKKPFSPQQSQGISQKIHSKTAERKCVDKLTPSSIDSGDHSNLSKANKKVIKKPILEKCGRNRPNKIPDVKPKNWKAFCNSVLNELLSHNDSWPFRSPVDVDSIPLYKEIIDQPMDLSLIRQKLDNNLYEKLDDFTADIILMLNNCKTFNEDNSPIGKAGHSFRRVVFKLYPEFAAKM